MIRVEDGCRTCMHYNRLKRKCSLGQADIWQCHKSWTSSPYRAINKKMCRVFLTALILLLVCGLVGILCSRHVISSQDPSVYIVKKGDTLWDISKTIYGDMQDAREMVYLMMKINNIEDPGRLQPGMKIYLPIRVD